MRTVVATSAMLILLFGLLVVTTPVHARVEGVSIGVKIPHDLTLLDQNRKKRSFDNLSGKKGIVLVFIRSASANATCQKQILELNQNKKRFKDNGYNIVVVSHESVLSMTDFLRQNKLGITILSDPRSKSIDAFDVRDQQPAIGTRSYGAAKPSVFIIGKNQKLQASLTSQNNSNRPTIDNILSQIKRHNPRSQSVQPSSEPPMTIEAMGQDPIVAGDDVIALPIGDLPDVLPLATVADSGVSLSADDYEAAMAVYDTAVEEGSSER